MSRLKHLFAIDCYEAFCEKVLDGTPQQILWLADNDGEVVFDIAFVQELVKCGHHISIVGKADNASNDATLADLHEIVNYSQFRELQTAIQEGIVKLMSSGAKTIGTNLYQGSPEFFNALLEAESGDFKRTRKFLYDAGLGEGYLLSPAVQGCNCRTEHWRCSGSEPTNRRIDFGLPSGWDKAGCLASRTL